MKEGNGIKADDPCEMEKEVTLLDFLIVILKHKWLVIFCVLIATAIAVSHISYTNFKSSKISAPEIDPRKKIFAGRLSGKNADEGENWPQRTGIRN